MTPKMHPYRCPREWFRQVGSRKSVAQCLHSSSEQGSIFILGVATETAIYLEPGGDEKIWAVMGRIDGSGCLMSDLQDDSIGLANDEKESSLLETLNDLRVFISRFCAFPSEHCLVAVTLWAAAAHIVQHLYTTPRLALLSPEAASGKTRVLEILDTLVR